jgi:hypothetical protein
LCTAFRIPRAAILDVVGVRETPERWAIRQAVTPSITMCEPFTSPSFDRGPAWLYDYTVTTAIARKSLGRTAAGAEILQRTRNSARDLELAHPLRRTLGRLQQD